MEATPRAIRDRLILAYYARLNADGLFRDELVPLAVIATAGAAGEAAVELLAAFARRWRLPGCSWVDDLCPAMRDGGFGGISLVKVAETAREMELGTFVFDVAGDTRAAVCARLRAALVEVEARVVGELEPPVKPEKVERAAWAFALRWHPVRPLRVAEIALLLAENEAWRRGGWSADSWNRRRSRPKSLAAVAGSSEETTVREGLRWFERAVEPLGECAKPKMRSPV